MKCISKGQIKFTVLDPSCDAIPEIKAVITVGRNPTTGAKSADIMSVIIFLFHHLTIYYTIRSHNHVDNGTRLIPSQ